MATNAAERAADALCVDVSSTGYCCSGLGWSRLDLATIIDEETGLSELLEALSALLDHSRPCDCVSCRGQFTDYRHAAKAALAKARGGGGR